ncbi:multicomponent Na+:H+ antiporter subunit C [Chitinophaga terrae (ex Kim and Jung 2007)]|jgi:multicomponent Na+:H+ antiporter subunit C|uniref:Multicomponent Na+:H+ antiporter subunit C n=1 Tax=Chitinophaga terrae (ex Kim and Jung 2007) TaxID=408074 RepID=A0A1H4FF50_9BACT|nr:Na+/H+ antiporter subunit C [Chitinophaga terrae (ex Kim and Jung 2007)]MDQ0110156.1 multicomponent Na+:H+ antiporter subunit C [Chitinophaga terrae (ex Kim and Jung 2007)]GEP92395.1 cation:proton antiporter [Chitinophaga terrae (ex Kim and Jung 2007)]SEA95657.1 multicomponent Na+:H+ antiporter subunit C [Chitinophaga terrae (ex Kim and Jung 2007)]
MELLLLILIGILYATGIFMMLRRSMVKLLIGLILLGNGANMLIFLLGGITRGKPPIIGETDKVLTGVYADPVPQSLILTAIVISFGLQAFAIVLLKRVHALIQTDDLNDLNTPDTSI